MTMAIPAAASRPAALAVALLMAVASPSSAAADVTGLFAEALVAADTMALDRLLAPNFLFVASSGHIQDKEHFLAAVGKGSLVVKGFTLSHVRESVIGSTRVVTGTGTFDAAADTPLPAGLTRFSLVIEMPAGSPERVVLVQLTPVIPTGECPDGTCRIR